MAQLDCILFGEDPSERDKMERMLDETGHIHVRERVDRCEALGGVKRLDEADLVLASLASRPEKILEMLESLELVRPMLVVIGPPEQSDWVLRAIRLGARDYLPPDVEAARIRKLTEELTLMPSGDLVDSVAPVIGVLGAKGGVGATTVASQLASALQASGRRVCAVDLNLQGGDLGLFFDMRPRHSLAAVAQSQGPVDASFVESLIERHSSGVWLLAAPQNPEEAELITAAHVERTLEIVRRQFDLVVVDLPNQWDDASLKALDLARHVYIVYGFDLPSISHVRAQLTLLGRLGIPEERTSLLANRANTRGGVRPQDAATFLERSDDFRLPNDYEAVMDSIASGVPVHRAARRSELGRAFEGLAHRTLEVCGLERPQAETSRIARLRKLWRF